MARKYELTPGNHNGAMDLVGRVPRARQPDSTSTPVTKTRTVRLEELVTRQGANLKAALADTSGTSRYARLAATAAGGGPDADTARTRLIAVVGKWGANTVINARSKT